jgi:NAD(P)-dependent dehydrogenase (short-subunit alcohol dehydrogenase family)
MSELNGKVAIVTGAAGGIGAGIVKALSQAGASVVLSDYDAERLEAALRVAGEIPGGSPVAAIGADVTSKAEIKNLVEGTIEEFGRLDVLVNNAGVLRTGPMLEISEEEWNLVLTSNLTSAFLCSQAVLPGMIEQGSGAIVNIASVAAFNYTTPHVHYAASKAGMVAFSRDLAYEVAPHGVRVNAIAPSGITSPMNQEGLAEGPRRALESAIVAGRWGQPEDVGDAVVFLASERASFILGTTLSVSGGSDLNILSNLTV